MLKAVYKHTTFYIYTINTSTAVQITLIDKCLRQYLMFESGPAEIPMCELSLSGSHPIPSILLQQRWF